jgi:acyl-CoA reductase-like NAD-dependent aldehyde dehydrogenase
MGQGVIIEDGKTIINRNPATNEIISRVPCTTTSEIQDMMDTAQTAFNTVWGNHKSIKERINCLQVAMEELSKKGTDLIPLIVQEMGKPIAEATAEFNAACNKRNGQYMTLLEHSLQPIQHGTNSVVIRQPLGVAAILSPWNFPLDEILLLALPALGSGNTVIVKPSEVTPEVGALVVNTLASMLPKGVLQLAQGDGIVGAQLVSHPITRMVAMTGSSATGKHIMKEATKDLKRLVLELGGKDPMVVFDDCDVEKAARDAVEYSLCNAGQVCCSIERVYVADSIYNTFCDQVKQVASAYKVGNGMNPNNKIGPLVSSLQMLKVKEQVDDAIQNGATLLYQSETPTTGDERLGTFYPVTVLADMKDGMKLYREETFGPVVCISKFDNTESEAIRLANDTDYGLGSCVYTQDVGKATRIANQIEAGQVGINCYAIDNMDISCPWVGHKQSGYGYHSGKEGFHNFSIPKTIVYSDAIPK